MSKIDSPAARLLKPGEAARYLAISPRTLWSLTAGKEIPHVPIGRRSVRYDQSDLDAYIEQKKTAIRR